MPLNVTLASSLLDLEIDQYRQALASGGQTFRTGIASLDKDLPEFIWRGGDVVAVGNDGLGINPGSLPLELIVTYLLEQSTTTNPNSNTSPPSSTSDTTPSVFIIAPPYQATSTIQRLYTTLKARLQQTPKPKTSTTNTPADIETLTKSHLSRISLLQHLDISGLAESISEVLSAITDPQIHAQSRSRDRRRGIVLLQGVTSTITTMHRRGGTLQSAAMVSSVMQGLRNIARTSLRGPGGGYLVLVEVDVIWDGGVGIGVPAAQNMTPSTGVAANPGTTAAVTSGLKSAFSSRTGKVLRINMGNVYARIIEEGVDVVVAVHDGEGRIAKGETKRIVECVRDERGFVDLGVVSGINVVGEEDGNANVSRDVNSFGSWSIWN